MIQTKTTLKIINDPIYGFITIPNRLLFDLIEHPYFQRLRRVSQMGLSNMVYPGANHTRFHHAIGCMHLMQKAVRVLRFKGVAISDEEANALYVAILLHDIGHGAFSHALEHSIVHGISHEEISLKFMKELNTVFKGQLSLAIEVFEGKYKRTFLNQLISSQLDIDRLDYLKRDSFYTGVTEGNISSDRLIAMMYVQDDVLVIEEKGLYSVEKFLIARRLMYWQVYLHKTGLVAESVLVRVLQRAKELVKDGVMIPASSALLYFLNNEITERSFDKSTLEVFASLDDYDVWAAIKEWCQQTDVVLSSLSKMLIHRNLLKITIRNHPFSSEEQQEIRTRVAEENEIPLDLMHYFVFTDQVSNQAYNTLKPIKIMSKKGELTDIAQASDQLNLQALTKPVVKYIFCHPKKMKLA